MDDRKQNLNKITLLFWMTLISSIIFSLLFEKIYISIFSPILTGGLAGFDNLIELRIIEDTIFAIPFFLPLFILIFVPKKQLTTWLIFVSVPFLMFLVGGGKYLLWFFVLTVLGSLIGWLIKKILKSKL